jgi:hypothetical protein
MNDKIFHQLMEVVDAVFEQYCGQGQSTLEDRLNQACMQIAGIDYEMYQKEFYQRLKATA